jgi:7-cyano-7-deazaguanine reductase
MQDDSPLGRPTTNPDVYAPEVLFGIPRKKDRVELGLGDELPFTGVDLWNAYELSWLNETGKPVVAIAELVFPATSPKIVESKSLKLYFNSLNGMRYASPDAVKTLIARDLRDVVGTDVELRLALGSEFRSITIDLPKGECIDSQDLEIKAYDVDAEFLAGSSEADVMVEETLYSNLLKTNCPVTGQPDWATISLHYQGARISRSSLLRYIVSYRNHDGFHEQCVEQIFMDIHRHCHPEALSVYARYTRRGGLDINPFRSNFESPPDNLRLWRQ